MKTKILSLAILALAATFNAFAQDAAADLNPSPAKSQSQSAQWPMPI